MKKLLTASTLTLALTGVGFATANAEEPVNIDENKTIDVNKTIIQEENALEDYIITPLTLAAQYLGVTTNYGEFKTNFYIGTSGEEAGYRFNVKNNGLNTFDWKITRPNGTVFGSGTLNPGKSYTEEVNNACPDMPIGTYKFSAIVKNGGAGKLDFAFRVLD